MSDVLKTDGNSEEIHLNSARWGLNTIRKLIIETKLLQIEFEGLTQLADSLTEYKNTKLPLDETARLGDDDISFKWSDQVTRYRAQAKAAHEIFLARSETLQGYIKSTMPSIQELPRPLPDDIVAAVEIVSAYARENAEQAAAAVGGSQN